MDETKDKPGCSDLWVSLFFVVLALAFVAAIVIPSLLKNRTVCIPDTAESILKNFVTSEATWRQNDLDGNGVKDYWVGDVSGFYRVLDASGSPMKIMDIAVAKADFRPLPENRSGKAPQIGPMLTQEPSAKCGYFLAAIPLDENGKAYAQDGPDPDNNAWENEKDFAFCAWPEKYNASGINTFIVNGDGIIWKKDCGKNSGPIDRWPAVDPATQGWEKVE